MSEIIEKETYPALEIIFLGRHLDFVVISAIFPPIMDVVVVDRAPKEGRPGPLHVDGLVGLAS